MPDRFHLTARQAADALGVTRATLYAYASRGQLRSEPVTGRTRERRYLRDDIERLKARKEARRDPSKAAAQGLNWGAPVLDSGITLIHDDRLYYRGRDALHLSETWTAEQTAAWLWSAETDEGRRLFKQPPVLGSPALGHLRRLADDPVALMQIALPTAAAVDLASADLRPAAVRSTGARILSLLTSVVARDARRQPIHRALQIAWAPAREAVGDVIRTALVLCADHELNVSAFTARCAASAGAAPYDVVSAALATLKGHRHGGVGERVLALADEAGTPARARAALASVLRRGERPPGFGHPLYPAGDPRARLLLRHAGAGREKACRPFRNLVAAGEDLLGDAPNLDFGLAAVTRAYGLPESAPLVLFALGRTIGWIAHALEQYEASQLIRPRARYTGPAPTLA